MVAGYRIANGWGVYMLLPDRLPTLQDGVQVGYLTREGGIHSGGEALVDQRRQVAEYRGGTMLGYVARGPAMLNRHSKYYTIVRGGADAGTKCFGGVSEGEYASLRGAEWHVHRGEMHGPEDSLGYARSASEQGRTYVYFGSLRAVGYVPVTDERAAVGACAFFQVFYRYDRHELSSRMNEAAAQSTDFVFGRHCYLAGSCLEALQLLGDMIVWARKNGGPAVLWNSLYLPDVLQSTGSFLGPSDATLTTLQELYATTTAQLNQLMVEINHYRMDGRPLGGWIEAAYEMWRAAYEEGGGYEGICGPRQRLPG